MANPFGDDSEQILEGFLCPICKTDLKTPDRLSDHFEKEHEQEQDLLKSFKDIFITARKKIRNFDQNIDIGQTIDNTVKSAFAVTTQSRTTTSANQYQSYQYNEPQTVGAFCDHISYYKVVRAPRLERYASETNKLIIRLHKLLTDRPTDSVQQKQHEQTLVPWLDGSSVKLCPNCAKKFNIARRQHHCRLCGSIMCKECSQFLPINYAVLLVNPTVSSPNGNNDQTNVFDENDSLRICDHCLHLLENRKEMQDSQSHRPTISIYYDKIQELKKLILPDIPMYTKMIASLYDGDSIFTLADASALRGKIGLIAEKIDAYSKAILNLPCQSGSREEALKKSVRLAAVKYIKDELLSLDPLPPENEIKERQQRRKMETEQRIERERRLMQESMEKYELIGSGGGGSGTNDGRMGTMMTSNDKKFASGSAVTSIDHSSYRQADTRTMNDPLIEQINIIKGYIKQARDALRFDEVATLELNLRELQQEYYNRQNPIG